MSFFVAALWSILAVFGLEFLLGLLPSVRANGHPDLVSGVLCQAAAFLGTLLFFTQVHEKDRPLSEVLGLRRTSTTLCLVATALGLAMQGPLTLIQDAIERRYPLPEKEAQDFAELFHAPFLHQKIAILLAAGFLGPIVEEMFFRGALLRAIRRRHPPGLTVVGVSLL